MKIGFFGTLKILHEYIRNDFYFLGDVVESEQRVREHKQRVRYFQRVRVFVRDFLDEAHRVISQISHCPSGKWRKTGHWRLSEAGQKFLQFREGVARNSVFFLLP